MMNWIWIIPLLPLAGALLNGVVLRNRASKSLVTTIACGSVLLSLLLGLAAIADYLASGGFATHQAFDKSVYIWVPGGISPLTDGGFANFQVEMGFLLDPLSARFRRTTPFNRAPARSSQSSQSP